MGVVSATATATAGPKQLSDQNSQGTLLGVGATDKIGFFGGTGSDGGPVPGGIVQPASQGSLKGTPGTVTVYATTQSPVSVAINTTAEQDLTVTGLAVGQVVALQKPTNQAGLAIVGARVKATDTLSVTFANDTGTAITPTASQTYLTEAWPVSMVLTATLSPAAVGPNAAVEQQFAVTGLPLGAAVVVNKPTAQAGLGIVGVRSVSAGVVGITFENFTAATITPTASEAYLVAAMGEVQVAPVFKALRAALTPVSVAANTTAEQTFTVAGLPANSQVVVNKPSFTTGLGIGSARVSALNTLAITYINNTAAAIVPPAETYTIGLFPGVAPAAGSSTAYAAQVGGGDHAALVALGLVAGP